MDNGSWKYDFDGVYHQIIYKCDKGFLINGNNQYNKYNSSFLDNSDKHFFYRWKGEHFSWMRRKSMEKRS